jgi:hypothetical protein
MNTKKLLEHISEDCLSQLTKYKYNKGLNISDKYRKGKITSYQYVLDLIYHFFEKDRLLKIEFDSIITNELNNTSLLKNGDYKNSISEVLSEITSQLNHEKEKNL